MTILLETLGDPIWQALTLALVLVALLMLMVVRTRDARLSAAQKSLERRLVLVACLVAFVFVSAGDILLHSQQVSSSQAGNRATTMPTPLPQASPTLTRVPSPSQMPTAAPRLARSITAVLTTFCGAITHRDYQMAWLQYARSLQHTYPEEQVIAAWERYTRCYMPEQSGDPAAWTILILTLAPGYTIGLAGAGISTIDSR